MEKNKAYMSKALRQAEYAYNKDEVPVGAVIVYKDRVIAQAYNQVELLKDPTAHAEMIAITQASSFLKSKWLEGCSLYVTIEPCSMCAGALVLSRIDKVFFGATDPKTGAFGSKININSLKLNHKLKVKSGLLEKECSSILQSFFKKKRKKSVLYN
jgi:tRNA(adenine34) deaminase|tara:strand:+ start:672 stop:1139 length:468 start_codon:yes stop_codon:yes gene_type:complete